VAKLKGVNWRAPPTLRAKCHDEPLQPSLEGAYTVVRDWTGVPAPDGRDAYFTTGLELLNSACAGGFRETHLGEPWSRRPRTNLQSGCAEVARIRCRRNCGVDARILLQHKAYTAWEQWLREGRRAGRGPRDRRAGCGKDGWQCDERTDSGSQWTTCGLTKCA